VADNREVNAPGNSGRDDREPIRILPPEGRESIVATRLPERPPIRWRPLALGAVVLALAVLVVITSAGGTGRPASPTEQPRSLAAIQPEEIDLTTTGPSRLTAAWTGRELADREVIAGIVVTGDQMLAVGSDDAVAQIWRSRRGDSWNPATEVAGFNPTGLTQSLVINAFPWGDRILAFGPIGGRGLGVWGSTTTGTWDLLATATGFSIDRPFAVAPGNGSILAVSRAGDGYADWTSPDGLEWTSLGYLPDLNGVEGGVLRATGDWFYMLGSAACGDTPCPAIFRSPDGISWERTDVATNPHLPDGTIRDLTATTGGLVAIGVAGGAERSLPGLWSSPDGASWAPLPIGTAFASRETTIDLTGISLEPPRQATITVNGQEHTVVEGSTLVTDAGRVAISSIYEDSVGVRVGTIPTLLRFDTPATLTRHPDLEAVAAQGSRLLIAGEYVTSIQLGSGPSAGTTTVAAVWVSADGGTTWETVALDDRGGTSAHAAALLGNDLAVAGGGSNGGLYWHTTWDTATEEADVIAATTSFLEAVAAGNTGTVLADLAPTSDSPLVQIPGLGKVEIPWWSPGTGLLDPAAVTDTLTYLAALHSTIEPADCSARVEVGILDSAWVYCAFSVASDLTRTVGAAATEGRVAVTVASDGVSSLEVFDSASFSMWRSLSSWARSVDFAAGGVLGAIAVDGTWDVNPTFTGESASAHLEAARRYSADVLSPGEVRVGDTSVGRTEWRWLTELPDGASRIDMVVPTDLGFVALGSLTPDGRDTSLWSSPDGLSWTPLPQSPLDSTTVISAHPGGVLAAGAVGPNDVVAVFDGAEWTATRLPNTSAPQHGIYATASTTAQTALVRFEQIWNDEPLYDFQLWVLDAAGDLEPGTFPDGGEDVYPSGLVATDDGFLLATIRLDAPGQTLHSSPDGLNWTEVPDRFPTDAMSLASLTRAGDRYVVSAYRDDMYCLETDGGSHCVQVAEIWTSPDGSTWAQAFVADGDPVTGGTVGAGEMGAVAIAGPPGDYTAPRAVYLSPDGASWERLESPLLLDPEAAYTWFTPPAVGTDAVVIAAASGYGPADPQQSSLIVGHLVKP
jgi:hypothetical protein